MTDRMDPAGMTAKDSTRAVPPSALTGLLLAGGAGRRLGGCAKGLVHWRGRTLAERALARLEPAAEVLISANEYAADYAHYGCRLIADPQPGLGPLGGVVAGLAAARTPWLLTAPCDAPLLPADYLARMTAGAPHSQRPRVAHAGGRLHPTCLLLHHGLLADLEDYLRQDARSMYGWLEQLRPERVDFPVSEAFTNINTPDDLERLLTHHGVAERDA